MLKKLLVVTALAATALLAIPSDPADARRGARAGGARIAVARSVRPRVVVARPVIVRRHVRARRVYVAPILVTRSSCEWLRRRAIATGSPYWWRRYRACRGY